VPAGATGDRFSTDRTGDNSFSTGVRHDITPEKKRGSADRGRSRSLSRSNSHILDHGDSYTGSVISVASASASGGSGSRIGSVRSKSSGSARTVKDKLRQLHVHHLSLEKDPHVVTKEVKDTPTKPRSLAARKVTQFLKRSWSSDSGGNTSSTSASGKLPAAHSASAAIHLGDSSDLDQFSEGQATSGQDPHSLGHDARAMEDGSSREIPKLNIPSLPGRSQVSHCLISVFIVIQFQAQCCFSL
jgi:hypothetical protein